MDRTKLAERLSAAMTNVAVDEEASGKDTTEGDAAA